MDPLEAMHNIMSKPNDFLTKNPSVPSRLLGGLWEVKIDQNGFLGRPSAVCVCMGVCARRPANIEKNRCQKMIKILIEKKRAIPRQGGWPGGLRWALGGKTRGVINAKLSNIFGLICIVLFILGPLKPEVEEEVAEHQFFFSLVHL